MASPTTAETCSLLRWSHTRPARCATGPPSSEHTGSAQHVWAYRAVSEPARRTSRGGAVCQAAVCGSPSQAPKSTMTVPMSSLQIWRLPNADSYALGRQPATRDQLELIRDDLPFDFWSVALSPLCLWLFPLSSQHGSAASTARQRRLHACSRHTWWRTGEPRCLAAPAAAAVSVRARRPIMECPCHPLWCRHGWKFIRFGPDGALYIPIGANCNGGWGLVCWAGWRL